MIKHGKMEVFEEIVDSIGKKNLYNVHTKSMIRIVDIEEQNSVIKLVGSDFRLGGWIVLMNFSDAFQDLLDGMTIRRINADESQELKIAEFDGLKLSISYEDLNAFDWTSYE